MRSIDYELSYVANLEGYAICYKCMDETKIIVDPERTMIYLLYDGSVAGSMELVKKLGLKSGLTRIDFTGTINFEEKEVVYLREVLIKVIVETPDSIVYSNVLKKINRLLDHIQKIIEDRNK